MHYAVYAYFLWHWPRERAGFTVAAYARGLMTLMIFNLEKSFLHPDQY
jgi:hypothetical protein